MKLCIFGSRSVHPSPEEIDAEINRMCGAYGLVPPQANPERWVLICGMASGADSAGEVWARQRGIKVEPYPVKLNAAAAGRSRWSFTQAAYARNRRMAEACDVAIGWWKGQSGGTANMAAHCAVLRKPCWLVDVK